MVMVVVMNAMMMADERAGDEVRRHAPHVSTCVECFPEDELCEIDR